MALTNYHLQLSSFLNPLAEVNNMTTLAAGFFEHEVVRLLAQRLNFTYTTRHPPDILGPGVLSNGSWTGCMGQIQRKEVDICVSFPQTWETNERRQVADFTYPIVWDDIGMLMPAPLPLSKTLLLFLPFSNGVWACLFFTAAVVTSLLWWSYRNDPEISTRLPLSRWFLFIVATLSTGERGYFTYNIAKRPGRVYRLMAFFWCFPASIVLSKLYCSFILSMLTIPNHQLLVRGISDLPYRPDVAVYVFHGSLTDITFSNHLEGEFKSVAEQLRQNPHRRLPPGNIDKVIEAIHGNSVFLASRTICQSIMEHVHKNLLDDEHQLILSNDIFQWKGRQMMLQKDSPLTSIINQQIALMHEHGLIHDVTRRTMADPKPFGWTGHQAEGTEEAQPLNRSDVSGGFFILITGIVISILVMLAEYVHRFWQNRRVDVISAFASRESSISSISSNHFSLRDWIGLAQLVTAFIPQRKEEAKSINNLPVEPSPPPIDHDDWEDLDAIQIAPDPR